MKYLLLVIRVTLVSLTTSFLICGLWIHSLFVADKERIGFFYRRIWARCSCAILGMKVEVKKHPDKKERGLYVSNHRSLTDPIVQIMFFDAYIIAKAEVNHIPIIGKGASMTGIVFVDRARINSRVAARVKTNELLESGMNVLVYPEGTTTVGIGTEVFRRGTFNAAKDASAPVIPVAIEYRDEKDFWHSGGMATQLIRQIGSWRTHVRISIGEAYVESNVETSISIAREWIDQELVDLQSSWSRVFTQ